MKWYVEYIKKDFSFIEAETKEEAFKKLKEMYPHSFQELISIETCKDRNERKEKEWKLKNG